MEREVIFDITEEIGDYFIFPELCTNTGLIPLLKEKMNQSEGEVDCFCDSKNGASRVFSCLGMLRMEFRLILIEMEPCVVRDSRDVKKLGFRFKIKYERI